MPLVLALPSKWTVLPLPVHTIYAAKLAKLAKGIRLALDVWVMSNHSLSDTIEHMPCHTKTATKFILLEERGVGKVIGIKQGVASLPVAVQVGSTARE